MSAARSVSPTWRSFTRLSRKPTGSCMMPWHCSRFCRTRRPSATWARSLPTISGSLTLPEVGAVLPVDAIYRRVRLHRDMAVKSG